MLDNNLIYEKVVSSTNDRIKEIKQNKKTQGSFGLISELQLNGKGRKGNEWISNAGDLTCSILIEKQFNINDFGKINIIVAVIIMRVLVKEYPKLKFKFKWPNDIFIEKKKIAGILLETSVLGNKIENLIIGFGLNIISEPVSNNYKTTCLKNFTSKVDINDIFKKIFKSLDKNLTANSINSFKTFKQYWLSMANDIGKMVKVKKMNSFHNGIFKTINHRGSLVLVSNSKKTIIES